MLDEKICTAARWEEKSYKEYAIAGEVLCSSSGEKQASVLSAVRVTYLVVTFSAELEGSKNLSHTVFEEARVSYIRSVPPDHLLLDSR